MIKDVKEQSSDEHAQDGQNVRAGVDGASEVDVGVGATEGSIGGSRARVR